jgi:hypothetical protein
MIAPRAMEFRADMRIAACPARARADLVPVRSVAAADQVMRVAVQLSA